MYIPLLFVLGLAIGSFMNVLALRYDGEHFLFDVRQISGRSHCPHCGKTLRWFELVPVASFIFQGGKCRSCGARIGFYYPLVELVSAGIFVAVPAALAGAPWSFISLWIFVFELLVLMTYIDIRLQIIPDELTVFLGVAAVFEAIIAAAYAPDAPSLLSRAAGALFGSAFFAIIIAVTRGKGMGWGDVKLGLPLGFLFGWPGILALYAAAFMCGAFAGIALILSRRGTMKSAVPFAPFLALATAFVFFLGPSVVSWYFRIIGI